MHLHATLGLFAADIAPLSAGTRRSYTSIAAEIVRLLGEHVESGALTPHHFLALVAKLKRREYVNSTANAYSVVARRYLLLLIREDLLVISNADQAKIEKALRDMRPPRVRADPVVPTPDDLRALVVAALAASSPPPLRERNIAFIELLIASGLRIAEAASLRCGQIDLARRRITVRGKGRHTRQAYLSGPAVEALSRYWRVRGNASPTAPALAAHSDDAGSKPLRAITPTGLRYAFDHLARAAGLPELTPHKLRHAFASHLQRTGHDVTVVQRALGHANLATTQVYVHTDNDEVAAQVDAMYAARQQEGAL